MRRTSGTPISMRWQLIIALGCILLTCQIISALWLWHESKEQIEFLVDRLLTEQNRNRLIAEEIREAIASLSIPSLVMVAATLLLSIQAVNRITQPLSRLEDELSDRTAENLEPITEYSRVKEIAAVTHSMNQLFARLNDTLKRERQFTTDVAHELRTPLSGIRLHLELYEQRYRIDCQPLIQRIDNMVRTVEQLLQLARAGQAFSAGDRKTVSLLKDVILPMRNELDSLVRLRAQRIDWQLPPDDVKMHGDATLLQLLLRNLIENAYRYSPQASVITVRLQATPAIQLQVSDQGPGIDENKVGELSKAFVRMDSRYGGIGLGLSIVTRIAQLHRGQFFLSNRKDTSGADARIVFTPLAPESREPVANSAV